MSPLRNACLVSDLNKLSPCLAAIATNRHAKSPFGCVHHRSLQLSLSIMKILFLLVSPDTQPHLALFECSVDHLVLGARSRAQYLVSWLESDNLQSSVLKETFVLRVVCFGPLLCGSLRRGNSSAACSHRFRLARPSPAPPCL